MKLGYGFEREPEALRKAGAERCWIDHANSGRAERARLFGPHGLRDGDVLVLLDRGDLGKGKEIARFEAMAEAVGVTVEIAESAGKDRLKPGRKSGFNPTPEEAERCRHWWQGPFRRADALREIEQIMGRPVSPDQLNRRVGLRGGGVLK